MKSLLKQLLIVLSTVSPAVLRGAVEVPLRDGHALHFRSLHMPEILAHARFYWNEYPRQIDNKRGFAFKAWEGWPGNGTVSFPNDQPIAYRYELVIVHQERLP